MENEAGFGTLEGKGKDQVLKDIIKVLKKADPENWRDLLLNIVKVAI